MKNSVKIFFLFLIMFFLPFFLIETECFGKFTFTVISIIIVFYYPIYFLLLGIYAGMDVKKRWNVSLFFPFLFSVLIFGILRVDGVIFMIYSIGYFTIEVVGIGIVLLIKKRKLQNKMKKEI